MAKVAFTKISKIKTVEPINCEINTETIQIQSYLPVNDKLKLIQSIIEYAGEVNAGFYNIVKLQVCYVIEMIRAYTNISFTDKQLEDYAKLYDLIQINNIWEQVSKCLPASEKDYIWENVCVLAKEETDYTHSALGVLEAFKEAYRNEEFDLSRINEFLQKAQDNPEEMQFIKAAVTKMA